MISRSFVDGLYDKSGHGKAWSNTPTAIVFFSTLRNAIAWFMTLALFSVGRGRFGMGIFNHQRLGPKLPKVAQDAIGGPSILWHTSKMLEIEMQANR